MRYLRLLVVTVLLSGGVLADDAVQPTEAMCTQAVARGLESLEVMRRTVARNVAGGHMTQGEHDEMLVRLNGLEGLLAVDQCMASRGVDLEIYLCLSANDGDIVGCTQLQLGKH